jgi:hypothetical protein
MEKIRVLNFGKGRENQGKEGGEGDFFLSTCLVCFMYLFCFVFILGKGESFNGVEVYERKIRSNEMRSWSMRWSEWGCKMADENLMCPKSRGGRGVMEHGMGLGPHLCQFLWTWCNQPIENPKL